MKRASILGALAVVAGFFLAAPAAHAVEGYIANVDVGNGVMCSPRVGGTIWPVNGTTGANARFFYCGSSTAQNRGSAVYTKMKGISTTEPSIGNLFTNNNVKVYVMTDVLKYIAATGAPLCSTFDTHKGRSGRSNFTALGAPENAIIIFEKVASGTCPTNMVVTPLAANLQGHDAVHEAGHHFDRYQGMLSYGQPLSATTPYSNLYPDDVNYSDVNNPNHNTEFNFTYNYWWGTKEELFAEEFAANMNSRERQPLHDKTSNYFRCTDRFNFGWARNQAAPSTPYPYAWCTP